MDPATNPMLQRHSYLWQRLRDWLATALNDHTHTLEYRTRDQLTPLRIWLTLIENILRRLILMAASTAKVDVKPQWSPEPKPQAEPETQAEAPPETPEPETPITPKSNTPTYRFRLYGINWPRKAQPGRTFTGAAPPTATSTQALFTIRIHIRDPLLNVGPRPARRRTSRTRHAKRSTAKRTHIPKRGIDLTVDDFLAWTAAHPSTGNLGDAAWQEMLADLERQNRAYAAYQNESGTAGQFTLSDAAGGVEGPGKAVQQSQRRCSAANAGQAPGGPSSPQPELISTQPLLDRLAVLAEIARNPEKLIQRAARAFARRREIALKLSKLAARKETGFLALSRHLYGTLIPLDAEFRLAMEYFAVSYVECDTS